jgi:hypothetical protein
MPRYRLFEKAFARRAPRAPIALLDAGTVIEFDGIPGASMSALDDAARAAVPIPGFWRGMHGGERIHLARRLGAAVDVGIEAADKLIDDEFNKREQLRRARSGGPPGRKLLCPTSPTTCARATQTSSIGL